MNARHLVAVFAVLAGGSSAQAQIFTFDSGAEGWRVFDIFFLGDHAAGRADTGLVPPVDGGQGLPAPALRVSDVASETWIGAPAGVLGARPDLMGQSISFDIFYRAADNATYASVGIESAATSLWIGEPQPPINSWVHRSYEVAPGRWHVTSINGPLATAQDIAAVLGNVTGIYIHTEWNTGPDDTGVDNISIGNPAPSCGNADFNCDGDTGTDADIEAFFACLAGGCPAAPCASSADFNGDGDTGTDADIESFFRVLAGGSC